MMKKKLIYTLSLCGLMLTASSCSSFLDQESSDEVIVSTVADYNELLLGSGYPSPTSSMYNLLYVLDDDFGLQQGLLDESLDESAVGVFPFFTWQPDMWTDPSASATYDDCYSSTYERIKGANAVLDGIDDAIGDDEERDQVKAEALALRAYYYYMLVNIFSEPYSYNKESAGIPLKLTANLETSGLSRGTVAEVYDQIIGDLKEAADLFGKYTKRRGTYRINRPTVEILLCRAYLQMEQWDKVVEAATEAIKEGGDITDYSKLSSYVSISKYDYSEVEWVYGNGNTPSRSLSRMGVSDDFASLINSNDYRYSQWFSYSSWYGTWTIYKHRMSYPSGYARTPTNSIRMSEAWLSRAEAYAQQGNTSSAQSDLQTLQSKRYKDMDVLESATSDLSLLEQIRRERRIELCYDELRWFDLRRYGMPRIEHVYKNSLNATPQTYVLAEKDPMYTIPIPADDVTENGNIQQNASASQPARTPSN